MLLITTSRKPSRRTRRFCRELSAVLPLSLYVNRGKASLRTIAERAVADGYSRVLVVGETKGNPSLIRVLDVAPNRWEWKGQLFITSAVLRLDRHLPVRKIKEEDLVVDADVYADVLRSIFDVYDGKEGVVLKERGGNVSFVYDGESVGPEFKVVGWSAIPESLNFS
jgi:hypothetical protein